MPPSASPRPPRASEGRTPSRARVRSVSGEGHRARARASLSGAGPSAVPEEALVAALARCACKAAREYALHRARAPDVATGVPSASNAYVGPRREASGSRAREPPHPRGTRGATCSQLVAGALLEARALPAAAAPRLVGLRPPQAAAHVERPPGEGGRVQAGHAARARRRRCVHLSQREAGVEQLAGVRVNTCQPGAAQRQVHVGLGAAARAASTEQLDRVLSDALEQRAAAAPRLVGVS